MKKNVINRYGNPWQEWQLEDRTSSNDEAVRTSIRQIRELLDDEGLREMLDA